MNFLRELVDGSGGGLRGLHQSLTPEHLDGAKPPGYNTLSARLKGQGLHNDGKLVHAIVAICAAPARQTDLRRRAAELLLQARSYSATPRENPRPASADQEILTGQARIISLLEDLTRTLTSQTATQGPINEVLNLLRQETKTAPPPGAHPTVSSQGTPPTTSPTAFSSQQSAPSGRRPGTLTPVTQLPHPETRTPGDAVDPHAELIVQKLQAGDPHGLLAGHALRDAIDHVLDGERTGRFDYKQLIGSERLVLNAKLVNALGRAWSLPAGQLDFKIAGIDVDTMFSHTGRWMLAPEQVGQLCLLGTVDDARSLWSLGVLRLTDDALGRGANRDGKRALTTAGKRMIRWIYQDAALPENILLHLPEAVRSAILSQQSSQERIDELFRTVQGKALNRVTVTTVAMQADAAKRVRDARRRLKPEGITILGYSHDNHATAREFGLPLPRRGEWLSTRLEPPSEAMATVSV
ncbi:NaeI family type II restriction endonuclease [Streptomyces sp. NPDC001296]